MSLKPGVHHLPGEQGTRDKASALPEGKNDIRTDSKRSKIEKDGNRAMSREGPATEEQNATSGPSNMKSVIGKPGSIPRDPGKH